MSYCCLLWTRNLFVFFSWLLASHLCRILVCDSYLANVEYCMWNEHERKCKTSYDELHRKTCTHTSISCKRMRHFSNMESRIQFELIANVGCPIRILEFLKPFISRKIIAQQFLNFQFLALFIKSNFIKKYNFFIWWKFWHAFLKTKPRLLLHFENNVRFL